MKLVQGLIRVGSKLTNKTLVAWNAFNGIMVAYKPAGIAVNNFQQKITTLLCNQFNAMQEPTPGNYVSIIGPTNKEMTVQVHVDYSQHRLALGPVIEPYDIMFKNVNFLGKDTSGVLVMGVNDAKDVVTHIKKSKPVKLYRLKGILGQRTSDCFTTGKIVVRSSWKHVKRYVIDKVCASMQSSHQKKMFELLGVDIQSETAYQLAVQGPIKPADNKIPMVYSIKCVDLSPPEFTLEIVCLNEDEDYLKLLIDNLGLELHTNATCTEIKCLQFGFFHLTHAMVINQMSVETVLNNMQECYRLIGKNRNLLYSKNPIITDNRAMLEKKP